MKLKSGKTLLGTCMLGAAFALGTLSAQSASFSLNDKQLAEAVELGKTKHDQDETAFRFAYINNLGYGYPSVLLRTEYLAVADYVRRSEYQRHYGSQKIHELTDERIESARREVDGKLQFMVTVYGPDENFTKDYDFHLMAGDKKVMPAAVDKPAMADSSGFKGKLAYAATIILDFPTADLKGDEKIKLILDPPDGLGPSGSRNANFEVPFDLSAVK